MFFSGQGFFKKTNENTSHSSKNEFILSFFGRIHGLMICIRNKLTFKSTRLLDTILMAVSTGPQFPGVFQFQDHSSWQLKSQMRCQSVTINKTIIKTTIFLLSLTVKVFFQNTSWSSALQTFF